MKMRSQFAALCYERAPSNDNIVPQSSTVAIECPRLFAPFGPVALRRVSHIAAVDLTKATMARLAPTTVVMPLIGQKHDAMSLIAVLEGFDYRGRILVIGPALPDPAMVQTELRTAGPQERLTLISA